MRWTGRIRLLFLTPAVVWVLAFTIFPTLYTVYAAFHTVKTETVTTRAEVPRLDASGKPMLKPDGTPRTKTEVTRATVNTWDFVGLGNFGRVFTDPQVREAARVTAIFVVVSVSVEMGLGLLLAFLFNRSIPGRGILRTIMILPIFATRWRPDTCSSPSSTRPAARWAGPASPGCRTRTGPWCRS